MHPIPPRREGTPPHAVPASLYDVLQAHPKAAIAFSGGVDSSYLLYAALACRCDVRAYCMHTQFQPQFEIDDALRMADHLGARMTLLPFDVLALPAVAANPADRCYHCKQALFSHILQAAQADGYAELWDGTNASDDAGDRPGMRALAELRVFSPLRAAGLAKDEIRTLSHSAGLFTWDKPAYACLATRILTDTALDAATLQRVERAEGALAALGFSDLRVRVLGRAAKLQLPAAQLVNAAARHADIRSALAPDFDDVWLDLQTR